MTFNYKVITVRQKQQLREKWSYACDLYRQHNKFLLEYKTSSKGFPLWHSALRIRRQWLRSLGRCSCCSRLKDLVLLQRPRRSQLQLRFNPWPGNFHILWVVVKKKGGGSGVAFKTEKEFSLTAEVKQQGYKLLVESKQLRCKWDVMRHQGLIAKK